MGYEFLGEVDVRVRPEHAVAQLERPRNILPLLSPDEKHVPRHQPPVGEPRVIVT